MSVRSIAALPAAAGWRAPTAKGEVDELFEAARRALGSSGPVRTRVLVTSGPSGVVHDRAVIGGAHVGGDDVEVPVDGELMAAVAGRTGFSRGRTDRLAGDLAELVRWSAEAAPELPLLPLELPEHASTATLEAVATGLRGAADATGRPVGVVAAGDLAVSKPAPGGHHSGGSDAARFDEQVLEALRARDVAALGQLGPRFAGAVGSRGWGPLVVTIMIAEMVDLPMAAPRYQVRDGRGRVVIAT
jgi:hypothetical protein